MRLPDGNLEWVIDPQVPPQRLDHYLKHRLTQYSRTALQQFIDRGSVRRREYSGNYQVLRPASTVRPGDVVILRRPAPPPPDPHSLPRSPIRLVFEDDCLVVIDKPAGMLVHPAGIRMTGTVIGWAREQFPHQDIHLAHRLDRETSGLLILARGTDAARKVKEDFKDRRVKKRYLAIVTGQPSWTQTTVFLPISDSESNVRVRQAVRPDGFPATTHFRLVRTIGLCHALLEAIPETGRLHQIRVHLEAIGHALVGDKIYGSDGSCFLQFREQGLTPPLLAALGHWRHALHASYIMLQHPRKNFDLELQSDLPSDLAELIGRLENDAP